MRHSCLKRQEQDARLENEIGNFQYFRKFPFLKHLKNEIGTRLKKAIGMNVGNKLPLLLMRPVPYSPPILGVG